MRRPLVLASQSPRRRELLSILGIPFTVLATDIPERPAPGEQPIAFALRIAEEKAREAGRRVTGSIILAADTIVTIGDEILGKPESLADATRMLERLSGRQHDVITAVCVLDQVAGTLENGIDRTAVWMDELSPAVICDYIQRENVLDKAGAYGIQGFAAVFIPKIEGNYFNVMGLPLPLVYKMLCRTSS